MANVRIELNREGVAKLLKGAEVQAMLKERCRSAVASLGNGYEYSVDVLSTRAVGEISAESFEARLENAENNTILKALK